MNNFNRPIVGITLGDTNGIGPEVVLKSVSNAAVLKMATFVLYASKAFLEEYISKLKIDFPEIHQIEKTTEADPKKINIIDPWREQVDCTPGIPTQKSAKYAYTALQKAVFHLRNNYIHALVTAPIHKYGIVQNIPNFVGHTEYLQQQFKQPDVLMFMVSEHMRIALATAHVPLSQVQPLLTKELLTSKLNLMIQSLKQDFGITKPKIAVLGVNPHAGENGSLGKEEIEIIHPVIDSFQQDGHIIAGPFAADGFFATGMHLKADAVLAMYHDQGLIPFKFSAFETGVNFTAGLPGIRTSPDHGTAFDLAGKNKADESSMRHAIYLAVDVFRNRHASLPA